MKKRKKRGLRLLAAMLAVILAVIPLGGCGQKEEEKKESIFQGNPDAIRIFVRESSTYADILKRQFPDMEFDFYYYGGLNTTMIMNRLLEEDDLGDICFNSLQVTDEMAEEHLLNLSGYPLCGRYEPSILREFDVKGKLYQLPGYITMRNIIYNRDMFEQYGWKEPQNFSELTDLCHRIRKEANGVTPIVMAGAAEGYYFTTMSSYAQAEFLYTQEGRRWTEEYRKGNVKSEGGFQKGIEMVQRLIDAEAFDYDKNVGLWDGPIFEQRMLTGEAAMMFGWGGQTLIAEQIEKHQEMHFDMMPFRNENGQAFIGTNIPYYIALSKNLGEKGNEKKLKNVMRIMDWLSTEEGIQSLSTDTLAAVFPLKNAKNKDALDIYQNFWNEHLDSIKAPMLYAGYEDIIVPVADRIIDAIQGKGTLGGLSAYIDNIHQSYLKGGAEAIEVGSIASDFTHQETVQMFAHMLHEKGDSDIALVSDGDYKNGVLNTGGVYAHFMEGPIIEDQLTCSIPGKGVTNPAVQLTLTGKELKYLLENGKSCVMHEDSNEVFYEESSEKAVASARFDYYWDGMTVEWDGDKVASIRLDNGTVLKDDASCTITCAYRDYTEETASQGNVRELSYTVKDAFAEYLKKHSPLEPVPVLR